MAETETKPNDERVDRFTSELEDLIETVNVAQMSPKSDKAKSNIESEDQPKNKMRKTLFIIVGAILFILIIAIIFRPRRPPRDPFLPIPYVFNRPFMKTLMKYASLPSHNQVLVLGGPQGMGKTRALVEIAPKFNQSGYLPLELDFNKVSQYSTPADVREFLMQGVLKAFQYIEYIPLNMTEVKTYLPYISNIPNSAPYILKETNLNKMYKLLNLTLGNGTTPEYDQFFNLLDTISNFLHIVILANEPFRFKPFITFCRGFQSNTANIGAIFDVADLFSTDILSNPEVFRVFYVEEFDEPSAKTIFVDVEYVFTKKQFPPLWKAFGGKGFYWAEYYDYIRDGYSQNDAINLIRDNLAERFVLATNAGSDRISYYDRVSFLKKVVRSAETTFSPNDKLLPILAHYSKWELLTFTGPYKIVMTDKIMIAAIKKALKTL